MRWTTYRAHVWVNGRSVAYHEGGHTPFTADITPALEPTGSQVIVVRAQGQPVRSAAAAGQAGLAVEPACHLVGPDERHLAAGMAGGGAGNRIFSLRWTPDVDARSLNLVVRLRSGLPSEGALRLRVVLRKVGQTLADDSHLVNHSELQPRFTLVENDMSLGHSDLVWSPDQPNLIDATITLLDGDKVVDEVASYTALRSFTASAERLLLNGRPYFLRLVLAQNFWPRPHRMTAPCAGRCS